METTYEVDSLAVQSMVAEDRVLVLVVVGKEPVVVHRVLPVLGMVLALADPGIEPDLGMAPVLADQGMVLDPDKMPALAERDMVLVGNHLIK